jgi:hypothetical protein
MKNMANKNIQMKQKNGASWDKLYPLTLLDNIFDTDGTTSIRAIFQKKMNFNVKDYGAKGDNVADDTQAIKDAIAAAVLVNGCVFFPVGTYKISDQLNITVKIKIQGVDASGDAGTIIRQTVNKPIFYCTNGCVIENLNLRGTNDIAHVLMDGIYINNVNDVYVRNVFISQCYNCVHVKDSVFYTFFDNVRFQSAKNCLFYGEGTTNPGYAIQFNDCMATPDAACNYGFLFKNAGSVMMDNVMFSPTQAALGGVVFDSLAPLAGVQQISNCVFEGVSGAGKAGLFLKGSAAIPIKYVHIDNCYIAGNPAIETDYANNIYISNSYLTTGTDNNRNNGFIAGHTALEIKMTNVEFQTYHLAITATNGVTTEMSMDVVNCTYNGGEEFIYLPFLSYEVVKRLYVEGGKHGTNSEPIKAHGYIYGNVNSGVPDAKILRFTGNCLGDGGVYIDLGTLFGMSVDWNTKTLIAQCFCKDDVSYGDGYAYPMTISRITPSSIFFTGGKAGRPFRASLIVAKDISGAW